MDTSHEIQRMEILWADLVNEGADHLADGVARTIDALRNPESLIHALPRRPEVQAA